MKSSTYPLRVLLLLPFSAKGPYEMPSRKKLIEVALPLDAINAASARGEVYSARAPSTLHLWWARRPLGGGADGNLCADGR